MIAAVVPVKSLSAAKSRLVPRLGPAAERLARAMLEDVLDALARTPSIARVAVVTPDEAVAEVARKAGAVALVRPGGINESVDAAGRELAPRPDDGLLVLLGDVAGARPRDLEALVAAVAAPGVALAPSNDGGTCALFRTPATAIPAGFGADSAKRHRELAERAGVAFRELPLPSLAVDIDEPEDLTAFLAGSPGKEGGGERTRALLRELGAGTK